MTELRHILIRRILTEKSEQQLTNNTYVFEVGIQSNKVQIQHAVETVFGVKVDTVRTAVVRGKFLSRFGRASGKRKNWKKAYVKLAENHTLNFGGEE
ncbi:MAG: 50S ribosomal protein L23 [Myxococcota bacterium]|nr:50S ribosomal protein L23 [Myxococcota bacterium]